MAHHSRSGFVRQEVGQLNPRSREYKDFVARLELSLGVEAGTIDVDDLYPYYADEIHDALVAAEGLIQPTTSKCASCRAR